MGNKNERCPPGSYLDPASGQVFMALTETISDKRAKEAKAAASSDDAQIEAAKKVASSWRSKTAEEKDLWIRKKIVELSKALN